MSTPYEVEHNVRAGDTGRRPQTRRINMESFFSFLNQISTDSGGISENMEGGNRGTETDRHNNPNAAATPVDTANLLRLLQDQYATLLQTSPDEANRDFLQQLISAIDADISEMPRLHGVDQQFLDGLDRVDKKTLATKLSDDTCPICAEKFSSDPHPLVVELPCNDSHRFDLECIAPWLQSKGTCPMCRKDFVRKKENKVVARDDDDEDEDLDSMYA